jgi:Ca2+-binding RTX toxin-like protein
MSLRPREYVLESLEQRVLLSADGVVPVAPVPTSVSQTPVEIVIVDELPSVTPEVAADPAADSLVDTSAPLPTVSPTATDEENDTADTAAAAPTVLAEMPAPEPESEVAPANPDVPSAADLAVTTLTAGNGPPSDGTSYTVGDTDEEDLSAWDPPLGGFGYTATNPTIATRDADYAALTALFTSGTGSPLTILGKIEKLADVDGGTTWTYGKLTLDGSLTFARHQIAGVDAVDGDGNAIFSVSFSSATGSLLAGGVTLNLNVGAGAFLISGDLDTPYTTGGLAGMAHINSITIAGLAATNTVTFGLTDVDLALNTTGAATGDVTLGGTSFDFDDTEFVRIGGTMSMSITTSAVSASLSGEFGFEVASVGGSRVITFALAGGSATMTISGVTLTATGLAGAFLINDDGVAGWASVTGISASGLPAGFSFGELSNVSVNLNTTGAATGPVSIPVGSGTTEFDYSAATEQDFFRVTGTVAININHGGFATKIKGTITFDRSVNPVTSAVLLRVAVTGGTSSFTAGTTTLAITGINGAFVIRTDGFAGRATVGGITLTGVTGFSFNVTSLFFEINTTNTSVTESIATGGSPIILDFAAPERHQFFRVQGTVSLGLEMGGVAVSLGGTFYFEQYTQPDTTKVVKFAAIGANASFTAGSVKLEVTGVDGGFLISDDGIAGFVTADAITPSGLPAGVTLGGTGLSFAINNTGLATGPVTFGVLGGPSVGFDYSDPDELSFVSVGGTLTLGLSAGGADVSVSGSMAFYGGTVDGTEVVKVGLDELTASIAVGGVTASITDIEGIVVVMDAGVAGRIQFDEMSITGISAFTFSATDFAFEFNTTEGPIDELLVVGGVTQQITYTTPETADFFRGSGHLVIGFDGGGFATSIEGTFAFETFTTPELGEVVKFGFQDVTFEIGVGSAKLVINDADGFFIFGENSSGVASYAGRLVIADAELQGVTGLEFSISSFLFETNTFGEAVTATIDVPDPGVDFSLSFTAADRWDFIALGGALNFEVDLGVQFTLTGAFYFEQADVIVNPGTPSEATVSIMKVSVSGAGFTLGASGIQLVAAGINGAFLIQGDGKSAGRLSIGLVELTGISGLTFAVEDFALEFSNVGAAVETNIPVIGDPDGVDLDYSDPEFHDFLRVGGTLTLTLEVGSFLADIHGTFMFEQTAGKMKIGLRDAGVTVAVGSIALVIDEVNGLFVVYEGTDDGDPGTEDGTLAMSLSVGTVALRGISGLTFEVTDFFLKINNTGGPVDETFIFPDDGDPDTDDAPSLDFDGDIFQIGGTLELQLEVGAFSATVVGTFFFEQTSDKIKVGIRGAGITVVAGSVTMSITEVNGLFVIYEGTDGDPDTDDGTLAMSLSIGNVTLPTLPALTFGVSDFFLKINNTGGPVSETFTFADDGDPDTDDAPTLTFNGDILALGGHVVLGIEVGSFVTQLEGSFSFEQSTVIDPDTDLETEVIEVSVTDASLLLSLGVTLSITEVNGAFVILPTGSAGKLSIGSVELGGIPAFSLVVEDFYLEFNNTGHDVEVDVSTGPDPDDIIELRFAGANRHDFVLISGTAIIGIGGADPVTAPMLQLKAVGVTIDTGATGDDIVFSALELSGTLSLAALGGSIRVSAHNLAVTADGTLTNLDDPLTTEIEKFGVEVFFGGTFKETIRAPGEDGIDGTEDDVVTGTEDVEYDDPGMEQSPDSADLDFKWPAWMPLKLRYIGLEWDDVAGNPDDFDLTITASITIAVPGITVAGYVENMVIDVGDLLAGEFPIKSFDAVALYVEGNLFGLQVGGGFVIGMIEVDADYQEVDGQAHPELVDQTLFYAGLYLKVGLLGAGGVQFAIGLAKIGDDIVPLEVMVGVKAPIIIEPVSGLTLGMFAGRVQFGLTLDSVKDYTDMDNLREAAGNPEGLAAPEDLDDWVAGLKTATLTLAETGSGGGPIDVWSAPMVITVVAQFYSSYVSQQALNGTLGVSFDTEGRILIAGLITFGGGSMKLNAALYADLTDVHSANFSFHFFASYGPSFGPKIFEIEASLTVKILKSTIDPDTGDYEIWSEGDDEADQATLSLVIEGRVLFLAGGAMLVEVEGTVGLEVDLGPTLGVRLRFNAEISIVEPTPNPLGEKFGELAGYVSIFEDANGFQMFGAVMLIFKPDSLKDYGIDVDATVFLQINTTAIDQPVTLEYFDGDVENVVVRAESFSLYLMGELSIGPPGSEPEAAFLKMNGFVIIEIDENGLTLVFSVEVQLAPGGTRLLTLDATGFMRINGDGVAARLDMTLAADFPPSTGLDIDAEFLLIINTTGEIVEYDIPEFVLTGAPGEVTEITIAQAAPALAPLDTGDFTVAEGGVTADGEDYYIIAASGDITALSFTLSGDFFFLITPDRVQIQLNAEMVIDPLGSLEVHGFLDFSSDGAAGLLDVELELDALQDYGIEISGTFALGFNTYTTDYLIPDAVADQFGLAHGSYLEAELIRIEIKGSVTIADVFEMEGRFFFESTPTQTTLEVDATMSMPIVGTLNVDGDLVLLADEGVVGSLTVTLQSAQGLQDIGLTFTATILLKVNTTGDPANDPGVADDPALDPEEQVMIAADTLILDMSGSVTLLGTFSFNGHFYFEKSGSDLAIRFDATLNIEVGTFQATGSFTSTSAGFQAQLVLTMQSSPALASVGFEISGGFLLFINSTNSVMTLTGLTGDFAAFNGRTIGPDGLKIIVHGQLKILDGFLKLDGRFELTKGTGFLEIYIVASINLAGMVSLSVNGFAGIYSDNPSTTTVNEGGLVLSFDLSANFNLAGVFTAEGDFAFRLNTTDISRSVPGVGTIAANYFRIAVTNLELSFLGVITVTGGLDITYTGGTGVLRIAFHASADFFGIGHVALSGTADSAGNYDVNFDGSILIGVSGFFGVGGTIHFHIMGQGEGITLIQGSIGGTAWLIGIGFGVNVGISWDAESGRLRASVALRLNFFLFSITIRGNFDLGYIRSTITWQAGTANDTRTGNGENFPGGELHVNVGDRALTDLQHTDTTGRNYSELDIDEQVFISQLAPGVIQVELFGKKKQYNNVTSVHVNTGSGNDYVFIDPSVTVPVFVDLGAGDDMADVGSGGTNNSINIWGGTGQDTINGGSGIEQIFGGSGDDYLTGGNGADVMYGGTGSDVIDGGGGADTMYGEDGDESFVWSSGDGQDAVMSGGGGVNSLSIIGDNTGNSVSLAANGSNFTATIDGAALNPTNVSSFFANLNGGADVVTVGLLDTTILDSVNLSLGYNDGAADQVTITGSSAADFYHLTSNSTTADRPVSTSYADPENPVTTYATVTTIQVRIAKTAGADSGSASLVDYYIDEGGYANDRVIINAGDGNDEMDAQSVVHAGVKLTLNGGNDHDALVGSSYDDTLNSGAGNDTVTGGPGVDTFSDAGGADVLLEQMDRNFTLNGWSMTSGSENENLAPAAFETIRLTGGASANTFTISNLLATTLWLDGGEHNDIYTVNIRGSGVSTIHIFDGGVGVPNTDSLNINGTAGDDIFLVRDGVISAGAEATAHYEVINYGGINGFTMHGGNGRDSYTVDEIRGAGAIYGDDGDDIFTVGRILVAEGLPAPTGIATIDTTRGWLTYGNFAVFEIYGGTGDDYFEVNHNQAELRLFGEAGDDLFWVRTFLEEGSALSTVAGGDGLNTIRYVKNGPLKIDGGAGFDRLVLEGTEADDIFVITDRQIFGGGRQIDFVNIEGIVLLGVGGNDTFWILGNGLPLEIQGGTGNDTVHIGGQAPDYVYDAPSYIVDPPAYIDHYVPVYTTPPPFIINIPAHWEPVRWAGITWWWNWVNAYQIVIPRMPYISSWNPVWVDPPAYTVDPTPITYKFKEVTQFDGVVAGVEAYNWATATSGPGSTPTSTTNLGTINSPVKFVGGNDPGVVTENDRLVVNLATSAANLQATMQTVDEIITDFNVETRIETYTNKGPIGQLLGLGLPDAVTRDGRTFMGGLTFLGVETSQFTFGSGNDTFTLDGTFNAVDVTVHGNGGNDSFNVRANSGDLVLNGNGGNDTFNFDSTAPAGSNGTLNGITGPVTITGGDNTDTIYLDDRADSGDNLMTLTTAVISGLGTGGINYLGFEGITAELGSGADTVNVRTLNIPFTLNTGGGADTVHVGSNAGLGDTNGTLATIAGALTFNGGTGGGTVIFDDTGDGTTNTGTLTGTTLTGLGLGGGLTYASLSNLVINLGGGGNTFTIAGTHTGTTNLSTGGGNDFVAINMVSGATNVVTGGGSDIIRVGTLAPTMTGGNLNAIAGLLTVNGGTGVNQLLVDDTGDTFANSGTLTADSIRGLGMALGIDYTNIATVTVSLGSGGDTFAVGGTITGTTILNLGGGNDALTLTASAGILTINGGVGMDTFNVQGSGGTVALNGDDDNDAFNFDSNAPSSTNGTLNAIAGVMILNGGNGIDALYLDDRLDNIDNVLTLTSTAIAGLGLGGGITYGGFENLSIYLGAGSDTANIRNIAIPTLLNTGPGNDRVFVGSNAGLGDTNGNLSGIAATLTIDGGGSGTSLVTLDDTGDASANAGVLTSTTVTGLGLASSITYTRLTTLTINLGNGGNTFTIESTHATTTNLTTGGGSDQVAIRTISGATNVDTAGSDDVVRVGSLAPAAPGGTLNGISALLSLTGGAGNNQLFLDDSVDAAANSGTLTATTVRGLGLAQGIDYQGFAGLTLGLGSGSDSFTIASTHAGSVDLDLGAGDDDLAIVSIAGVTSVAGRDGADTVTVNSTHLHGTNPIGALLNLDGNEGDDDYFVWFSGAGTSVVNVHDTGVAGTNNLFIYETPGDDSVLFRREFVALLQHDSAGVQLPSHEQVNYNTHINGTLTVTSLGGANYFAFDDNSARTIVHGSDEGDTYQIGQIFGPTFVDHGIPQAELIEVTRGWLSHGISHALTLFGGSGDDVFSVYHNRAVLDLNGADGDDTFVIRAFALASSVNGEEVFDALRGSTNVATGGGVNHIAYALNAPVAIDGGSGFNSMVVIATEFPDSIVVTQNGVYGGGLYVEFINIQELVINLAEGNDRVWILGTPSGTAVRIVAGLGSDTIYLGGTPDPIEVPVLDAAGEPLVDADGDIITTTQVFPPTTSLAGIQGPLFIEGGLGNGVPNLEPGIGLPGEPTGPLPDLGNVNLFVNENLLVDRIVVNNTGAAGGSGVLTSDRLTGFGLAGESIIDVVAFPAGMGYLEFEEIVLLLGSGSDTLTIASTHEGRTIVEGNDGNDTVNVRSISGHTTILGAGGADTVNLGSLAPLTGGTLDGIDALLAIDGGSGADTVNIDQRGNTAGSTGWLTQTTLTGLEMTSAIATVNDTVSLRVNATSGTFTLGFGSATPEVLAWNATADDLTAALWRLLGNRSGFAQRLGDEFIINFQGSVRTQVVDLEVTGDVTVTHRIAGVNYYGIDTLNLDLGSGADVLNVQGTAATVATNLNTHAGEDRIYVSSAADLTTSTFTDHLLGHLNLITGTLNVDGGTDRNLLMVSDEASAVANGTVGTPALLTNSFLRGFAPAQINYTATAGNYAQGITVWTGAGADVINVTSTDERAGVRTTTTLNTGAGDDRVAVTLNVATDGFFALNTQQGDDTADASGSSLPVIVFGGAGNDVLLGGSAGDILFGDNGRVQYLDSAPELPRPPVVVAVLGGGGPGDFTDGIERNIYVAVTADASIGGNDSITGNLGDDMIFGGAADDSINGGEGANVLFGDHGTVTASAGIVISATSTVAASGGADILSAGSGRDFILGGEAGDIIDAGAGHDAVAGDHGAFTITSATAFYALASETWVGGNDFITGGAGDDSVFGGAGNDTIVGNNGLNLLVGDLGEVNRDTATGTLLGSNGPEFAGGNDTIAGGSDLDVILGGGGSDTIVAGAGNDLVIGDGGTFNFTANRPVTAAAGSFAGAADDIQGNEGTDTILGGVGADTISGGAGRNVLIGEGGSVRWAGLLHIAVVSEASPDGGADLITGGDDEDLIFGGSAGDTIRGGLGADAILGDDGTAVFANGFLGTFADHFVTTVQSRPYDSDGDDTIFGEAGDDVIHGGAGNDAIDAGGGTNLVVGDHGESYRQGSLSTLLLDWVVSLSLNSGGNDTITAGDGTDYILGGAGNDMIDAGGGFNVVFGDAGRIDTSGLVFGTALTFTSAGGNDTITAGSGLNVILGGAFSDAISVAGGVNVILGDHGRVSLNGSALVSATTLNPNTGAGDTITAGSANSWIFGGDGADVITAADGFAAVFGDHGRIDLTDSGVLTLLSLDFTSGGADTIATGAGDDFILGGSSSDTVSGGEGNNVVLGDHGQIIRTAAGLDFVTTLAPMEGADDQITIGAGNDIVLGGAGADEIHAGAGRNVAFGDHGSVDLLAGDVRTIMSSDYQFGGDDLIDSGLGEDVAIGGFGADTIDAGEGNNVVLGDHGQVVLTADGLDVITTLAPTEGAADHITTGAGNDIILGGAGADEIHAGAGRNLVFGDHGSVDLVAGDIRTVTSSDYLIGGNDVIDSGEGDDLVVGGFGADSITAGEGDNLVLGDQGTVELESAVLIEAYTEEPLVGDADSILTGSGKDVILGGAAADQINAGDGNNFIVGDHAELHWIAGILARMVSIDFANGADDGIVSGSGHDVIIAGPDEDTIDAGDGDNIVFGDNGEIYWTAGVIDLALTVATAVGGGETITTGEGDDLIFGGTLDDTISAGEGNNTVFGDNGEAVFAGGIRVSFTTTAPEQAGNDGITTGAGDDVILGSAGLDLIAAGEGDNIVLGDEGELVFDGAGALATATTLVPELGSTDSITTGAGNDVILGGADDDVIDAGHGRNVVLGDHGHLEFSTGAHVYFVTTDPEFAGDDIITTGAGSDTILAGAGSDLVLGTGGDNVIFGDEAELTYVGGVLVEAVSIALGEGAADTITTGAGNDLIVGGFGADIVNGGDGDNVILGDNADALYSSGLAVFFQTLNPEFSAGDTITTGSGRDLVLGGQGADTISSGDGDDIVLGDEGSITLLAGVVQSVASESFADGMADTISSHGGNDLILGGHGADTINGGEGNNVIAGDNAVASLPGGVLTQLTILAPAVGSSDTIATGAGHDVIVAGAAGDTVNAGNGNNVIVGDQASITFLGGQFATLTPTTPEIGGNDIITTGSGNDRIVGGTAADWIDAGDGLNVVVGDHAIVVQNLGAMTAVESVAFADGGIDLIFSGAGNDLVIGGTAGDTLHAGSGNDLVFGDHALVTGDIDLAPLPLAMAVKPFVFTSISTQNLAGDGRSVAGDDVIFGDTGDDILLGQQGADILLGQDGDDDLIGGHNVAGGQDGADVLDAGAGYDVLAGDNASVLRTGTNVSPRAHVLAGDAMFDDKGNLLDLDDPQAWPDAVPERATTILDHAFDTNASLFGSDDLMGGGGDDVLFGQLGNDRLHGDASLAITVAADGTIDRTTVRAAATALFSTSLWAGAEADGDDYIEGNGGNDLIYGGLGQDDLVGGSSSLFGLVSHDLRPDGSDTIFGGNGTAAADDDLGDASADGRSHDADVILGDNANIIRLVGINGVNAGAFLTFTYAVDASQIIVRGFDLLDYTVPAAAGDIGADDALYGEAGDDTLHGQVGGDQIFGNGNDDNLYGGQGNDSLLGGVGDDSSSHSDELKPPPPAEGQGGATEGQGAQGTLAGTIILVLPVNIQATLAINLITNVASFVIPQSITTGFSTGGPSAIHTRQGISTTEGAWRVFASGILPNQEFGQFASDAMTVPEGPTVPADETPAPETPAEGETPATPPADDDSPAPEGDVPPVPPTDEVVPPEVPPPAPDTVVAEAADVVPGLGEGETPPVVA